MSELNIPKDIEMEAEQTLVTLTDSQAITVSSNSDYEKAANILKPIVAKFKEIEEKRKELKKPIIQAGKDLDDFFREPLNRLRDARSAIESTMIVYNQEQERIRREAELKAKQESAKAKLEAEEKAYQAIDNNETDKAEQIIENIETAPVVVARTVKPVTQGVYGRDNWKGEVVDMMELVKAVANRKVPINYLTVNASALNQKARSDKTERAIHGMRFYNDKSIVTRT